MTRPDDSKLYLYSTLTCFFISIILLAIYSFSAFYIEPKIEKLLTSETDLNSNLTEAYIMLKDPQIFARYENFDKVARPIKTIIEIYDKKVQTKEEFTKDDVIYLQFMLDRRMQGSTLTRNTMAFFLILSFIAFAFYLYEIRKPKKP